MLARLPPNKFVQRVHDDAVQCVCGDPLVCSCLYVGSQQAYGQLKRHDQEQNLADEQFHDGANVLGSGLGLGCLGASGSRILFRSLRVVTARFAEGCYRGRGDRLMEAMRARIRS
jgi:hypothetical protein